MIFKLRTSKKTQEIFDDIQNSQSLAPYILSKLAISLSLRQSTPISDSELSSDNNGIELNRQTITGEYDMLYKALITINEGKHISEEEFFPKYIKAHLDRGAILLENEFRYGGKFIDHLANLDKSI
ncbi:MAG: DndE family protein [Clostridia bacterium]|nr:DndE family protein [Clostridia bacterium]